MCDEALKINPKYIKALQQRARAYTKLTAFDKARYVASSCCPHGGLKSSRIGYHSFFACRDDVRSAIAATDDQVDAESLALLSRLEKQLIDIDRAEKRHRQQLLQQKQFHKKMMREAVGKLYNDKRQVPLVPSADDTSDTQPDSSSSSLPSRVVGWAMGAQLPAFLQLALVMIAGLFSRLLHKQQAKVKEL